MEMSESRARRAYELGRLRVGLQATWPLLLLVPLAVSLHGSSYIAPIATSTALLTIVLGWRGGGLARGARFGFVAGLPLLVVPWVVMLGQERCENCHLMAMRGAFPHGAAWSTCVAACALTGVAVGVLIGWRAARDPRSTAFAVAAAGIAALTGALGCAMVGVTGVLGVLGGLAVAAPPTLLLGRRLQRAA